MTQPHTLPEDWQPPFKRGDLVRIKGEDHLGVHEVDSCEWYDRTNPGVPSYWLCHCSEVREPVDWSKISPSATGVVTYSGWAGSADRLEPVS